MEDVLAACLETYTLYQEEGSSLWSPKAHTAGILDVCWSIFGYLSDALGFIHSQKTKHLDIKPTNIQVKKHHYHLDHRVYITDFGIPRSFIFLERTQTEAPILRTPKYCAPEVHNNEVHSSRSRPSRILGISLPGRRRHQR